MKKLLILLFSIITIPTFSQIGVQNVSTQEILDYNMDLGVRKITKKIPDVVIPGQFTPRRFFGNLTTDTLIAAISKYVNTNLMITPDRKIIVKPATGKIEIYKPVESSPETETLYTYKGKVIYDQKILINWASPSVQLLSGIDQVIYRSHRDITNTPQGFEEDVPVMLESFVWNKTTHTLTAYRPVVSSGHYGQQGYFHLQYTKLTP